MYDYNIYQKFLKDGYVIIPKVIDRNLVEEARSHISWLMKKHPDTPPEDLNYWLINSDPFWYRLISDQCLLDVAEAIIGPNIVHFGSHYFAKPPRTGQAVLWHQDAAYQKLMPSDGVISIWVALDDSTPENGCLRVIPKTHHLPVKQMVKTPPEYKLLKEALDQTIIDETKAVDLILQPGDVSVHHSYLIHGSGKNESNQWRRGIAIRYMPPSTTINHDNWDCAYLVRGKSVNNTNKYQTIPVYIEGQHMPFKGAKELKEV